MPSTLRFGRAELDAPALELRIDGERASLGRRGLDLLQMLVDQRHRTLSKHELLDTVWQGVIVEENNLQVQVSTLRRLLGAQAIATIPGRGYRFMLPVEGDAAAQDGDTPLDAPTPAAPAQAGNLPPRLDPLIGREAASEAVEALLTEHRLVTIVGAAGMGKTRLAMAVASARNARFADGAWLVELAPLNDGQLLAQTIAQALRLSLPGLRDPAEELVTALRDRRLLLLIDNCEHLVDAVGPLLDRLGHGCAELQLLTTSQEPLRLPGEQLYRLLPLSLPNSDDDPDAADCGAVRLFVERVHALQPRFEFDPRNAAAVVEVCRRLDGLPLAIELAAARVPALGVEGVREHLDERFRVLTAGSRAAPRRHQTLRAALDWSHGLLDDGERAVYRRLSVFVGSFSLLSAEAVAVDETLDRWAVLEHLASLVDKSLVLASGDAQPRYRMLESTREHALEQLAQAGEASAWHARHAHATRRSVELAIRQRRLDLVLAEAGNVRSAYRWARGAQGDATLAVALATLPSMALAVQGAVEEARARLLDVEPLVGADIPPALVAQYWQWYARAGLGGRLPPAHCIQALRRAEALFEQLGNLRHVHACRRHLAEALIDANELDQAAAALDRAQAMEDADWPLADRMRRLRVMALRLMKAGQLDHALAHASTALDMALHGGFERYELVLLDDMARMHLEAGQAQEAAERYRVLADRARHATSGGLTLSNALAGLVAALTANEQLEAADTALDDALPVLSRSGILLARADILAALMAHRGRYRLAAQLIGASDAFRANGQLARSVVEQRCRTQADQRVHAQVDPTLAAIWQREGAAASEAQIAQALGARHDEPDADAPA